MQKIRDGLDQWHYAFCHALLIRLLTTIPVPRTASELPSRHLLGLLAREFRVSEVDIVALFDLLVVTRSASGVSFVRHRDKQAIELAINFGGLEGYESGAEFTEYASYADDPVIGSRWAQNVDEALLLTLAHELAHHVVNLAYRHDGVKPHGEEFKKVYRLIRSTALNPLLDEFARDAHDIARARYEARLVRKIKALKKMSCDTTSNAFEAERALAQLQALIAKHGLEDSPIQELDRLHVVERVTPVIKRENYKPLLHVSAAIARFCGVESVIHSHRLQAASERAGVRRKTLSGEYLTFFGAPADVEMAVYLSELIHRALFNASDQYRQSETYQRERALGQHPRALLFSFRRAFIARINDRLSTGRDVVEQDWLDAGTGNKALMVEKEQRLAQLFNQRYPKLRTARGRYSDADVVDSAQSAGHSAADTINLGRPTGRDHRLLLPAARKRGGSQ